MRNQLAHDASASLTSADMKQLARLVDNLTAIDPTFAPVGKRYVELPVARPGGPITFGTDTLRIDFLIATCTFLGLAVKVTISMTR